MTYEWSINRELVERISRVTRLNLTEEEIEKFTEQLKVILENFKELDTIDTKDIEPSFQPQPISNILREDVVDKWKWDPLGNTKHRDGKYFKGPRIQ